MCQWWMSLWRFVIINIVKVTCIFVNVHNSQTLLWIAKVTVNADLTINYIEKDLDFASCLNRKKPEQTFKALIMIFGRKELQFL